MAIPQLPLGHPQEALKHWNDPSVSRLSVAHGYLGLSLGVPKDLRRS
jgi:hypothetical protein